MTVWRLFAAVLEAVLLALLLTGSAASIVRNHVSDETSPVQEMTGGSPLEEDDLPWDRYRLIAHALGQADGVPYLNCREGFENAWKNGCRLFEVDLTKTSDGVWVCRHSWQDSLGQWDGEKARKLSLKEFTENPLMGKYKPLTWSDLVLLACEYPDASFILDTKHYSFRNNLSTIRDYTELVSTATEAGGVQSLKQFIPEIYNQAMFSAAASVYPFTAYMYSLWEDYDTEELMEISRFCGSHGIRAAAVSSEYWTEEIQALFDVENVYVYIYTVNEPEKVQNFLSEGARGVVTDLPDDFLSLPLQS